MEEIISAADKEYFVKLLAIGIAYIHSLLPKLRHTKSLNSLRSRGHNYQCHKLNLICSTTLF